MTVIAAIVEEPKGKFELSEVELDDIRDNEVLVRVEASGICHMDVEASDLVPLPAIFGHEGVGIIEKKGSKISGVEVGDRVVISYASCGECSRCNAEKPYYCEEGWDITFSGKRLDGSHTAFRDGTPISAAFFGQSSFASHAITYQENIVTADMSVPVEVLAALPCGFLTGSSIIHEQFAVEAGSAVAVFGVGAVGLGSIMAAKIMGASPIIAIDVKPSRLELAKELGATHVINAIEEDVLSVIADITGKGPAYSVDTTGNEAAFNNALACLATGGRMAGCILPSPMEDFTFKPFVWFEKGLSMEAVSFGNGVAQKMIPIMIDWYKNGKFPVDKLVQTYPFDQINTAVDDAHKGITVKPVLLMDHTKTTNNED